MKKVWIVLSYFLVAALAAFGALLLQGTPAQPADIPAASTAASTAASQSKLDALLELIDERYIGDADMTLVEDAAAHGMMAAIEDQWSYYVPADELQALLETNANAYVGIGITIMVREEGYISVTKVDKGGPAEQAGIQVEDVIVAVNDQDILGMELTDVKNMVRGEVGTQVRITVLRQQQRISMDVTRQNILTQVASLQMLPDDIGLITIFNFDERCAQETLLAVESALKQGAQALIFDVRNNPGGFKSELIQILDRLLPEGPLFRSVLYNGQEQVDSSDRKCLKMPMAVLINDNSYSAAEFFAAALDEYDWAVTVGQKTTGKGRFQSQFTFNDGSAAVLSIGAYKTPLGRDLTNEGLTPDIAVDVDEETYMRIFAGLVPPEEDPQIQAAVEALKVG